MAEDSRSITFTTILGFFIALAAMGLPMIGVTINLYLGAGLLILAFGLLAYALSKWERLSNWSASARINSIWVFGVVYFLLVGLQVNKQHREDHPPKTVAPPIAVAPKDVIVAAVAPTSAPSTANKGAARKPDVPRSSPKQKVSPLIEAIAPAVTAVPSPTYSLGQCVGSACAQGQGSQATLNQFGPPPLKISFTTNSVSSSDRDYAYAAEVIVTTNVEFHPVSIGIICSADVDNIRADGLFFYMEEGIDKYRHNIAYIYYADPGLAAGGRLHLIIYSHKTFAVTSVVEAQIKPRA